MPVDEEMREEVTAEETDQMVAGDGSAKEPIPPLYTRIRYAMFLLVSFVICLLVKDGLWGAFEWIGTVKHGCKGPVFQDGTPAPEGLITTAAKDLVAKEFVSRLCTGYEIVFRFSFTLAVFFGIHALVQNRELCCVSDAQKNDFQSDYFCIKIALFLVLLIATMFIPNGFFKAYALVCVIGSGFFLVLQVILLIGFIYGWNNSWAKKAGDEPRWGVYLVCLTVLFYASGIAMIIAMFVEFTRGGGCDLNGVLITVTLVMGFIYTGLSVKMQHGSIFVSSIVFLYTNVICFSAIRNGDTSECNNLAGESSLGIIILSSLFVGVSVAWASVSAGSQRSEMTFGDGDDLDEDRKQAKNYLFFHCVMMIGSMYMAMILTNWHIEPNAQDGIEVNHGEITKWVQISSQWLAIIAYVWSLVAPLFCGHREFDFE